MLRFEEIASPTSGWHLAEIRGHRSGSRGYWQVVLTRDGFTLDYSDFDLERAWTGAVRAAEARDAQRHAA